MKIDKKIIKALTDYLGVIILMVVQWFRAQFLHEYAYHCYILLLLMIIKLEL